MNSTQAIHIAAAVITDGNGRCLLVRKRGTTAFMQPGGKTEPGEPPRAALVRELQEELSFSVNADDLQYAGQFTDEAVNEPGRKVVAEVFFITSDRAHFEPAAEIAEVIWYDPDGDNAVFLAPLTENHLIPLLKAQAGA